MREEWGHNADIKEILIKADQLIDHGQHEEAQNLIKSIQDDGNSSLSDKISCNLLKCKILNQQGLLKKVKQLANQTYKASLKLGNNILSVDSLIILAPALLRLIELEEAFEVLKKTEEILNTLEDISPKECLKRQAQINLEIGRYYEYALDPDLSEEYLNFSLKLCEKLNDKIEIAIAQQQLAWTLGVFKGNTELALHYLENSLPIFKKYDIKHHIARGYTMKAAALSFQGKMDEAIELYKQSIVINKELENLYFMANNFSNLAEIYLMLGELDLALQSSRKSLILFDKLKLPKRKAITLDTIIQTLTEQGDLEQAQQYFSQLEKLYSLFQENFFTLIYLFSKALLLKASPKAYDRAKAGELFLEIFESESVNYEFKVRCLLHLCELLLNNLSITKVDLQVFDQIQKHVNKLKEVASSSHSPWLLVETNLFQAKLDILMQNYTHAKLSIEEAQQITNENGLTQLNERILKEKEILIDQIDNKAILKISTESILELSNLTPLKEQIQYMLKKREMLKTINT